MNPRTPALGMLGPPRFCMLVSSCAFRYPWPIVAILGIVQVMTGVDRARLYGLAGRLASRFGYNFFE